MGRGDLTDRQWCQLELLLPPQIPKTGRPNKDHRIIINGIINGILWVLRTGEHPGETYPNAMAPGAR